MKKVLKGIFIFIQIVFILSLIFLASYTIFTKMIPDIKSGVSFFNSIGNIAVETFEKIKSIF